MKIVFGGKNMRTQSLVKKCLAYTIILVLMGTSAIALIEPNDRPTMSKARTGLHESSRDQTELRYYDPNTLSTVIGVTCQDIYWKTAIRLTHTELAPYNTWNITQVIIGFGEDYAEGPMTVRIYIYDKGTETHPGDIIVDDTTAVLNGTALIPVNLLTPVSLVGHDEIWVAVEWHQISDGVHYAFIDAGPHVEGKGDWLYLNNVWHSLYADSGGMINGNWALGAVVEGHWSTTLGIGDINGPLGIQTEVQNTGASVAYNISWSLAVKGGILGIVDKTATGTSTILHAGEAIPISIPVFLGFGKIRIEISTQASNAAEVTETKSAFLLGPLVIGIT
jgi:hypothetical protein